MSSGLATREIASQLFLSVGTVRWYLKHIYSKLYVHSRTQAILRARELNLLDVDPPNRSPQLGGDCPTPSFYTEASISRKAKTATGAV